MSSTAPEQSHNPGFDHIELAGEKVRLRPTAAGDAGPAFALLTHEADFTRHMIWKGPKNVSELAETYSLRWPEEMQSGSHYALAIEERAQPGIIGCIDIRPAKYPGQFEFGYWLGKPYWNRGYMAEALGLICYFCFERLMAEVIFATAFTGNPASRRVMEKNGFRLDGTLRRAVLKDGVWIDLWQLSLLREEWQGHGIKPSYEKLVPHQK
jgi:ribosomal-protein-alanine N-acetyltransferase